MLSPNNHGSVESGGIFKKGNDSVGDTPIFHLTMILGGRIN